MAAVPVSDWQAAQVDFTAERLDHTQDRFEPQCGLARFQINNEAQPNPRRQRKLRLRQAELFAGSAKCLTELLRSANSGHSFPVREIIGQNQRFRKGNFPFGNLLPRRGREYHKT
jgi:hypothetical protein